MSDLKDDFWAAVAHIGAMPDPRAKLVASQAALVGDMRETLQEQDAELHQLRREHERALSALDVAATAIYAAYQAVRSAAPADPTATMVRDMSGHINLMGALGDPDYMRGQMSCRHVDLRETKPRKKKETKT